MSQKIEISVLHNDIRKVEADLVILKFASSFHGADSAVAEALSSQDDMQLEIISNQIQSTGYFHSNTRNQIQANEVLFVNMPSLGKIHFPNLRHFSKQGLELAKTHSNQPKHVAVTIHGPGFGLDASVAFLAQISGLVEAFANGTFPKSLKGYSFVERNNERFEVLSGLLKERFFSEEYAKSSPTGVSQTIDIAQLKAILSTQKSVE